MRMFLSLMLLATTAAATAATAAPAPIFTAADFFAIRTVNHTAISPAGDRVAYDLSAPDAANDRRRHSIWIVPAAGGEPRRVLEETSDWESSEAPLWSPDGKRLAVPIAHSFSEQHLFVVDASGGRPRRIGADGIDISAFAWTPDSSSIAMVSAPAQRNDQARDEPQVIAQQVPAKATLSFVDVTTLAARTIDTGDVTPDDLAVSPDGKRLAFSSGADLYLFDLATRSATRLTNDPAAERKPQFSPDGTQLLFVFAQPREPVALGVIPVAGGTPRAIAEQFDTWIIGDEPRFFAWSADGRSVTFAGIRRMTQQLYEVSLADGAVRPITSAPGAAYGFSLSADRTRLAFVASTPSAAGDVYAAPRANAATPKQLTTLNPQLRAFRFGATETFRWTSGDLSLEGLLMRPPGYDASRNYAAVVLTEGTYGTFDRSFTGRASADTVWQTHFPFEAHALAAAGFLVFMPNVRGSWGFGAALQKKGRADYSAGPYADLMAGVDALVANGNADPERIGIAGADFDAYRAAYAIAQTTRFKAAAVDNVEWNLSSLWGELPPGLHGFFDRMLGGPPWKVPEAYLSASPLTTADNVTTPSLIFHADKAPGAAQAAEMASSLAANKVPYEYVVYPTGEWVISRTRFLQDAVQRTVDWMTRWLKP